MMEYTKDMKKCRTIYLPSMLDFHFDLLTQAFIGAGYKTDYLKNSGTKILHTGLKYVHNYLCFPATLIIGQMICALQSGNIKPDEVAFLLPQTGGGCRASNYLCILKKALQAAGYSDIPLVSLNINGAEKSSGFSISIGMIKRAVIAVLLGDLLHLAFNQTVCYEQNKGDCDALIEKWHKKLSPLIRNGSAYAKRAALYIEILQDFKSVKTVKSDKIKVAITGELYMKYCALGNDNLCKFLVENNCEVMISGFSGYAIYVLDSYAEQCAKLGDNAVIKSAAVRSCKYFSRLQQELIHAAIESGFSCFSPFYLVKFRADGILDFANCMGDGWFISADMLDCAANGYHNIVCAQPFGCLPGHICGKGVIKQIRQRCKDINIMPIEYDSSGTPLNRQNRIHLMLSVAKSSNKD